jgi:hypothetical protein
LAAQQLPQANGLWAFVTGAKPGVTIILSSEFEKNSSNQNAKVSHEISTIGIQRQRDVLNCPRN